MDFAATGGAQLRPRALFALLFLLAMVSALASLGLFRQPTPGQTPTSEVVVRVTGLQGQWQFSVKWRDGTVIQSVGEATVPAGIPLRFFATSADVVYSVYIPALGVKIDAIPGLINESVLDALAPGDYLVRNAEFAGLLGVEMTATLRAISE